MTIRTDWVQKTQGQPPKTTILTTPQAARYLGLGARPSTNGAVLETVPGSSSSAVRCATGGRIWMPS